MSISSFGILLFQIPVILLVTGVCGELLERLRQPRIVGEIAGGLLLGPLLLGRIWPEGFTFLFPPSDLQPLEDVGTIGLVLFLFLMGSQLDLESLRRERGPAFSVTFGSIYLPFAFGASLAPALRAHFSVPGPTWITFMLFSGVAMSINALPLLERTIQNRKGSTRPLDATVASTSLISAAATDLIAWSLLGVALALTPRAGETLSVVIIARNLLLLTVYVAGMLCVIRPLARMLLTEGVATWALIMAAIPFAVLNAQISNALGVHALFGVFLAGLCFPVRHSAWLQLERPLRPFVQTTLPVFFALTGLRLDPSMLSRGSFGWLVLIFAGAALGKLAGATLAARASGLGWRPSAQIGTLLNSRGLVELIVLYIGFEQQVLSPALYTLFVFMALLTTAMASPLLDLLTPAHDANKIWS
jgi:Kef-type K+ transport system membrane component KefB